MKLLKNTILFLCLIAVMLNGQTITWTLQSNPALPAGVELYKGTRTSPKLQAWYLDVDMNNPDLAVRSYKVTSSAIVPNICQQVGAYAAINGGFFGGSTSYSSVIYPGEVKAVNVQAVTRFSQSYPVLRSLFSMDTSFVFSVDWIYHFDATLDGLYKFNQPLQYAYNDPNPLPAPVQGDGTLFNEVLIGIGGAPTLVKDSTVMVTYNEEVMWGSGVGLSNNDPRTAVGYTSDNHVILFVADGRQTISEGLSLTEMAQVLLSFGCVEAMNLDGGGSTQMATPGSYINSPSEQRSVPSIFAVVHRDSLGLPPEPKVEKIIDTEDPECSLEGTGWFTSANAGYWGGTPAQLNPFGTGTDYAIFKPNLGTLGRYEVYAWWVASSNRCSDTPIIVNHKYGSDTVRVDQRTNGASWYLIGEYIFEGDTTESVIVSDAATQPTYIVADAIKFTAYDTGAVVILPRENQSNPESFVLHQNYPNPFNPLTTIEFQLPAASYVTLEIFNTLGQKIKTLVNEQKEATIHKIQWDGTNNLGEQTASGVYIYRLNAQALNSKKIFVKNQKMILLR